MSTYSFEMMHFQAKEAKAPQIFACGTKNSARCARGPPKTPLRSRDPHPVTIMHTSSGPTVTAPGDAAPAAAPAHSPVP
jgi:hypothetical protein